MCRRRGSGSVLAVIGQAARHVGTSLRAIGSVFGNPDVRKLQLAWGATSFAIWSFAIALGVYAFNRAGRLRSASRLWSACCRPPSSPRSRDCSGIGTPAAWSWSEAPRSPRSQSGAQRQPHPSGTSERGLPARRAGDDRLESIRPPEKACCPRSQGRHRAVRLQRRTQRDGQHRLPRRRGARRRAARDHQPRGRVRRRLGREPYRRVAASRTAP